MVRVYREGLECQEGEHVRDRMGLDRQGEGWNRLILDGEVTAVGPVAPRARGRCTRAPPGAHRRCELICVADEG